MSALPAWFLAQFNAQTTAAGSASTGSKSVNGGLADAFVAVAASTLAPRLGQVVTFTITTGDLSPAPDDGSSISVPFGSQFQVISATASSGSFNAATDVWTTGTIAAGGTATLTVTASVVQVGAAKVTAQITSENSFDPVSTNNTASVSLNALAPTRGLVLTQDQSTGPVITPLPANLTVPGGAGVGSTGLVLPAPTAGQNILTVGVGEQYATISAAVAASHDGDLIEVNAGTYTNDFVDVTTHVTIMGVGGMVNMVATENLPNEKGIFIVDNSAEIDNFTFTGATIDVADGGNGAGIRYEGGNLVLNNDAFVNNQDGVLAFPVLGLPSNTITINRSTFDKNGNVSGPDAGYTHNIYVGAVSQFTVNNSVFEEANVGHELKSRALATTLTNNIFYDGPTGTASYDIDLPNGGNDLITGNVIEKGPDAENNSMIHFGGEGIPYAGSGISVVDNTFVDDDSGSTVVGLLNQTTLTAQINNNTFDNMVASQIASGLYLQSNNYDGNGQPLASSSSSSFAPGTNTDVFSSDSLAHSVTIDTQTGVVGGGGLLTVVGNAGHLTVLGGSGGLVFMESPDVGGSYITTQASSTNTLDLLGVAGDAVQSAGTDTLVLGAGNGSFVLSGNSTITSGTGANLFDVSGTASILAGGNDTIEIASGATAMLTGAENYIRAVSNGGTFLMNITQDGNAEQATVVGGSLSLAVYNDAITMQTAAGGSGANITLGAGNAVITAMGVDTIHAGTGLDTAIISAGAQVYAGSGGLTVFGHGAQGASIFGAAGSTTIGGDSGGGVTYQGGAGANTVQATLSSLILNGGTGRMTVLNTTNAQIYGGSGGINLQDQGGSFITTQFGASDTIALLGGASAVISVGNDVINMGTANSDLTAYGNSTVVGSTGAGFYDFEGKDTFTALGYARVTVGGAATLTVVSSGTLTNIASNGGKVIFGENANTDLEQLTVTGGAGSTIISDATAVVTSVFTAANGRTAVTLGRGHESVASAGVDTIIGGAGAATISLTHAGASVTGGSGAMLINNTDPTTGDLVTVTGGTGSLTYTQNAGSAMLTLGTGAASVSGVFGAVTVLGSTGNVTLNGGTGTTSFVAGTKGTAIVNLTGNGGNVQFGGGSTTVTEAGFGTGVNYQFVAGHGGGTDVINNFIQGTDTLHFNSLTIASETTSGGSTFVTLSDHTKIVFMGETVTI